MSRLNSLVGSYILDALFSTVYMLLSRYLRVCILCSRHICTCMCGKDYGITDTDNEPCAFGGICMHSSVAVKIVSSHAPTRPCVWYTSMHARWHTSTCFEASRCVTRPLLFVAEFCAADQADFGARVHCVHLC